MKTFRIFLCLGMFLGPATLISWMLTASESSAQPPLNRGVLGSADLEGVPSAAMLTERGRQLANELRNLRRSRSVMGARHPTLNVVNERIKAIEEQLQAWAPASGEAEPNPFQAQPQADGGRPKVRPKMNDVDLRQLVVQLNQRIERLEQRVAKLESR